METHDNRHKRERESDMDSDTNSESGLDSGRMTEQTTARDKFQRREVPHHWEDGVLSFSLFT